MEPEQIARINELAGLAKTRALTAEETKERAALRQQYLEEFRRNTRAALESVRIQRPDGTLEPLKKKSDRS